jgi:hypothetical protein
MDASQPPKVFMDLAPSLGTPGYRLVDAGELYTLHSSLFAIVSGLAGTGTTQATGTVLKAGTSVYTPTAGQTAVVLPPGLPGQDITVVNLSGTVAGVIFGSGGDQIIPMGSATPAASLAQPLGTTAYLTCISKNMATGVATWKVVSLG